MESEDGLEMKAENNVDSRSLMRAFFMEFFLFATILLILSRFLPRNEFVEGGVLLLVFLSYFFLIPLYFKGRDVGMLLSKQHIRNRDGSFIPPKTIILRVVTKLLFGFSMVTIAELVFFRVKQMAYDRLLKLEIRAYD